MVVLTTAKDGEKFMKLLILGHAFAATALVFASVMTFRLLGPLPAWFGVLVGLILYGLTLWIAKAEAGDHEETL
jgi:hypothetical protein